MSIFRDPLGVLSLLLLIVPVMIGIATLRRAKRPDAPPAYKHFFLIGAFIALCLLLILVPIVVPAANLGLVWCAFVLWLILCWIGSTVLKRVMKFGPQTRKLVTALIFTVFLVFPLFYAFVLPEMEREGTIRAAQEMEQDRTALAARAAKGSATAEYKLGYLYATGDQGLQQDFKAAAEWYRKAADQGDAEAQAALGRLYVNGTGVEQLDPEAYFWLSLAAEHATDENKGWIVTLRDRTELYMDKKDIKAVKQRLKDWKPQKK